VPWTFFAQSVAQGGQSLVDQQQLLTKVYFPRLFMPTAAVMGCFIDFVMSLGVLAALLAWYGYAPSAQIVFLPLLAAFTVLAALGAAYLLSALTIAYRDFRYIVPVMIHSLMFLSPVIYPASLVPERYQWLLGLNPMAGMIDGFRSAILGKPWNVPTLLASIGSTLLLLMAGALYFRRTERRFSDIA
jgi:lipopolysaccharide transport system permease protein